LLPQAEPGADAADGVVDTWEALGAVRAWKANPDVRERLARVLQKVAGFHREALELVATATAADVAVRLLRSKR